MMMRICQSIRLVVLACGLGLLATGGPALAQIGGAARAFPDSRRQILVYADQLPSQLSDAQWRFVASHYVGSQKETAAWTQKVRQLNPHFLMLHYQLALGNGPALFVDGNDWVNDFSAVTAHEGWFVHDSRGNRLKQQDWDWYVMNIGFADGAPISGYPAYWTASALRRLRDNQDDGVFADSYTVDVLIGQEQPAFPWFTDVDACLANWIPSLNQFGAYCASALHAQPERFYYLPNLGGLMTAWDRTDYAVGDGGMIEGFAIPDGSRNYSTDDWKLQMGRTLDLTSRAKVVIGQTYIDRSKSDQRWFVVGSHLLTKGQYSYLNMFHDDSLEWYPEYAVDLGTYARQPVAGLSNYWSANWGVYWRQFGKGIVLVNPGGSPVAIKLGRAYRLVGASGGGAVGSNGLPTGSLSTTRVSSVTVPAYSARVLLF